MSINHSLQCLLRRKASILLTLFECSFDDRGLFRRREFSGDYYDDIFKSLGISVVITIGDDVNVEFGNDSLHQGFEQHLLPLEGGVVPPPADISQYFRIVDTALAAGAAVAMQSGGAGRGPTGTLAALYLMRSHGFTARQAIAWVRIIRPVRCPATPRPLITTTPNGNDSDVLASPVAHATRSCTLG